tara:strand:+ start:1534 stop:1800 length:267 start_codon:yes stop_codon:yes gene_type:complete
MSYNECKKFIGYIRHNYISSDALKDLRDFILSIIFLMLLGISVALLLYYSWWSAIPITLVGLLSFYVSMIWIDWKYREKSHDYDESKF